MIYVVSLYIIIFNILNINKENINIFRIHMFITTMQYLLSDITYIKINI